MPTTARTVAVQVAAAVPGCSSSRLATRAGALAGGGSKNASESQDNAVAARLYASVGFRPTEDSPGDEVVASLPVVEGRLKP
ncbi:MULTISPECIES: hypothetical protein [unclassified Streptomyces]|uniref:hypothetical protein n=1 Tax=unclassified Streptomyces TaxID=2593676 RepID=UPI0021C5E487|nr:MULTISPECIES: hypothetical protein [unclassified Streptomyces]